MAVISRTTSIIPQIIIEWLIFDKKYPIAGNKGYSIYILFVDYLWQEKIISKH